MSIETVKMIKKDAIISINVGVGFLQKLHEMLAFLVAERTQEEIEQYRNLVNEITTEFPEPWMDHLYYVTSLIRNIEDEAVKQNMTYDKEVDTSIQNS